MEPDVKLEVKVTALQLSFAMGAAQSATAPAMVLLVMEKTFPGHLLMMGATASVAHKLGAVTVTVKLQVAVFPFESFAV